MRLLGSQTTTVTDSRACAAAAASSSPQTLAVSTPPSSTSKDTTNTTKMDESTSTTLQTTTQTEIEAQAGVLISSSSSDVEVLEERNTSPVPQQLNNKRKAQRESPSHLLSRPAHACEAERCLDACSRSCGNGRVEREDSTTPGQERAMPER